MKPRRKRCQFCLNLTEKWSKFGETTFCYDGCYSTTGWDNRTLTGKPLWEMSEADRQKFQIAATSTVVPEWVPINRKKYGLS